MEELDLKELLQMFYEKKIQIVIIIMISMIIGCIYTINCVTPLYKASTTLILGRINASDDTKAPQTEDDNQITQSEISINSSLVSTYSELIKSKTLIKEVKENLKIDLSESDIRDNISVSRVSDTELIEITVTNVDPNIASKIANEIAKVFGTKVEEIYNISNIYIIDHAIPVMVPYNINHFKDIILFAIVGVIVSVAYTILCNLLDSTIKSSSDLEKITNVKTLISIPYNKNEKSELITYEDTKSVVSEAFRTLRTNVQFSSISDKKTKTYLITSCFQSEGKSYISANLAVTFAQAGKKVILIDADMRRGRQAKVFKFPNECGLSNYISNIDPNGMEINYDITQFIKETGITNLNIITSGNVPPNPSELLTSSRVSDLIKDLKEFYDVIIFDGAPVLPITDSLILARLLDSTILVTRHNRTRKDDIIKAKSDIENVGGKIIGTCLNAVTIKNGLNDINYYYYGSDEDKTIKERIIDKFNHIKLGARKLGKLSKVNKNTSKGKKIRIIEEVQHPKKTVIKDVTRTPEVEVKRSDDDIVKTVISEVNKTNAYEKNIFANQIKSEPVSNITERINTVTETAKKEEMKTPEELAKIAENKKIEEAKLQEQLIKAEKEREKLEAARKQEELKRAEEERKRIEEEKKQEAIRKAEEERKRIEEEKRLEELRKAEEERKRIEEEKRLEELRKAEEERKRIEEEKRQEAIRKAEEERKRKEEERKRKEEEARKKKEERERKRQERIEKAKAIIEETKTKADNAKKKIQKNIDDHKIKKAEKRIKAMEEQAKLVKEKLQKAEEERNKMFGKRVMFEIDGDEVDEIIDLSSNSDKSSDSGKKDKKEKKAIEDKKSNKKKIDEDLYPKI